MKSVFENPLITSSIVEPNKRERRVLVKNSKNIGVQRMEERMNKVTMRKMGAFKAERLEKRAKVVGISNYFPM